MPSIYGFKPRFQALLRPPTRWLAGAGVTANHVTLLAVALSVAAGALLYHYPEQRWPLLLVTATLIVRMALNAIDGLLAREHGQQSRLGALLNELGDVVSDAALYLPFAALTSMVPELIIAIVILSIISEMAGVVAVQIGASRRYDGPMGKSDRALAFGAVALLLGLGMDGGRWVKIVLLMVLAGLVLTIVNRAYRALAEAAHASSAQS